MIRRVLLAVLIGFGCCLLAVNSLEAAEPGAESVTTSPVLADAVLYVASTDEFAHRGHLRAINLLDTLPVTLWDAATRMPMAGVGTSPGELSQSDPPAIIRPDNLYRSLFTNLDGEQLPLTAAEAGRLQSALGVDSLPAAEILVHAVRGRLGGTPGQLAGVTEDPLRLWSISRSSPVLVGKALLSGQRGQRPKVLYAGAEDGFLHAFFVSRWDTGSSGYLDDDPDAGRELWGYLPGSFLGQLKEQPLVAGAGPLAVHLDGTPLVKELFADLDGDGRRSWSTLLVATGTLLQNRRSCLFVLDISDPLQPALLWEQLLPGENLGRSRGIVVDRCVAGVASDCIYLTADDRSADALPGVHALALELLSGQQLWQFDAPYQQLGPATAETPAVPSLMDLDGDGDSDTLLFGDLSGRLWALALADGRPYGEGPVYQLPGGINEPIGAPVTVLGSLAVFGSGGVAGAAAGGQYAVYAVEVSQAGGRLRWSYPLAVGEMLWAGVTFDGLGNLLFATARGYDPLRNGEQTSAGRIVMLSQSGEQEASRELAAATLGQVLNRSGVTVSVALTGEVTQYGEANGQSEEGEGIGSVKILSWRQR